MLICPNFGERPKIVSLSFFFQEMTSRFFMKVAQLTFTCSRLTATTETLENGVKYVES